MSHGQLVERFVGGKVSKPQFIETEALLHRRKEDLLEKMTQLINSL
jgi:hypothetical protein